MLTLFTNGFSPFARKVAMALEYKALPYESVDGLTHRNRERLLAVNPRAEVPVLVDGDITVVNSSDIVAYLDERYPERPIRPSNLKQRVEARALERLADARIDAIMLDCSIWTWADRKDPPLPGLKEAGQRDLDTIFARIEATLRSFQTPFPFGHLTIAEFALWPHSAHWASRSTPRNSRACPRGFQRCVATRSFSTTRAARPIS
jgi:glutathione S-transferase